MKETVKGFLSFFVRFGLSIFLLAYLYSKINIAKTREVVQDADVVFIFYGLLVFLLIHVFLLMRWKVFIHAMGLHAPWINVSRFFFIGLFGNLFLPSAIGGDVIKTIGLCGSSNQKPKVVASVLLDRLSGFAGMAVVAMISFAFGYRLFDDFSLPIAIMVIALGSLGLTAVLFNEKMYSFCCRIFGRFPRIVESLMNVHYDIVLLKDRRTAIYQSILLSGLNQVLLAVVFFLISKALHQNVAFIYFVIFIPLICIASCFPSIGGLGVREAGAAYLFAKAGMASGVAVSISLINFLFMVLVGVMGWGIFMITKTAK